jgi:small GTP-binding protein
MSAAIPTPSIKVVTVGEQATGKTSILRYLCYSEKANSSTEATIAHDTMPATLSIDGRVVRLLCWDTAGTEQYRSLVPVYLRDAAIILVVFSLVDRTTFDKLPAWFAFVNDHATLKPLVALVGNKMDLEPHSISEEAVAAVANSHNVGFYLTSARTGDGIPVMFTDLVALYEAKTGVTQSSLQIDGTAAEKSCC